MDQTTTQERFRRGAADAGRFFDYISAFVGFTREHAATIRETRFIIEKYIPTIVADFYAQLLRFPATRKHFQKQDGAIDQEYLQLRMHHQVNFWRRAASGQYGDDFARYVDYVGRSHTSQGADPNIYIPERYVIGMVGFVQQRIAEALEKELHQIDPDFEIKAGKSWNAFLMVILEMLSRSYRQDREEEALQPVQEIDDESMFNLSVETYERALGIARTIETKEVYVAPADEIPMGARKIITVDGLSIGVFHHKGQWIALHNSCLHRGGPICEGKLEGDTLTCPWHGYQYDVKDGQLLFDPSAQLSRYPVEVREGEVYLHIRTLIREETEINLDQFELEKAVEENPSILAKHEFYLDRLGPGEVTQVEVDGEPVAVYNVDGQYFATHNLCTHVGAPLSQGRLDGHTILCPWHDSCFDVRSGAATCGPAEEAVKTYQVVLEGETGIVKEK